MAAESAAVEFRIDRRSGVATYLQIVQQTKQALRLGVLEPGDRLPTAREVVEATAINPNTVLKAYRELEREGLVEARRGLGTFVRRTLGGAADAAAAGGPLRGELADWARRARAAGLEKDDVGALFTAVLEGTFSTSSADDTNDPNDTDDANGAETAGRSHKGGQER
ncbi:GntR family transcriptional regulator [Streptomyces sp. NRRL F-2295]|uniref:GntR family transcriptional regulator n=1 Tax=Streptomyces sp. NRRL F-2295 TaxID=1519477 RepID=UPI0006AFEEC4|nr:GntR family transcriptional regulator [Streptomyces sp. NRRL F-2295]KOU03414.1 GntR family transcriptional regulator [Streptomyces sp. NRRL F-2295]